MSYNGKYTSFIRVVESAFRDSGIDYIDFENAIEWTVELIGLIGIPSVYVDKVTDGLNGNYSALEVQNYRCKLPDDYSHLKSVRKANVDNDGNIVSTVAMVESTNLFHPINTVYREDQTSASFDPLVNLDTFDPESEDFEHTRTEVNLSNSSDASNVIYEYKLDQGYIFTNFESGYLQVAYKGLPIDADGYPLIPDDEKFRQALKYHIIFHIDWKTWRANPSPQNASIKNDSEQRRDFYVGSAMTKGRIPSIDQMESIKRMWLRSIPKVDEHYTSFSTTNRQEERYNQRYDTRKYRRRY